MKVPVVVKDTPNMNGMLTQYGAMLCLAYFAEEADWNGQPHHAKFWRDEYNRLKESDEAGVVGWYSSPILSAKLKEKDCKVQYQPYSKRHLLRRWI